MIRTVETNLLEGSLLVIAVLFAFLGNVRAGLIVASAIPLSMLLAFTGMVESRISANLMSLGAIDFGLIVDGAVVLVENVVRRLSEPEGRDKTVRQLTAEAAHEVVRPITFGIGIIILVYLPILSLEGIEGKMFKPMAWTVVFALAGSLLLTLTLTPVLASLFLKKTGHDHEPRFVGKLRRLLPSRPRRLPRPAGPRRHRRGRRSSPWAPPSPRRSAASSSLASTRATFRSAPSGPPPSASPRSRPARAGSSGS